MKKYWLAIVLLFAVALVAAENIGMQQLRAEIGKPEITKIGAVGKGIAVSTSDPLDFKMVRLGLVEVQVNFSGQIINRQTGLIWLEDEKYLLKNASIQQSAVSADVYLNNTLVGNINLVLVARNDTDVWVGKLVLNGKEYNVYLLEGNRGFEKQEMKQKIKQACSDDDENCTQIAKGIGNRFCEKVNDTSCREKIAEFCEQNPNDQRCQAIMRGYCANNTEDTRCRLMLKQVCKNNPADSRCLNYCQENPELCKIQIRQEVKERVKEKLQEMREVAQTKRMGRR